MPLPVHRIPTWSPDGPPTLLVVIDTEEEFDWDGPFDRTSTGVANIACQHLAQQVFTAAGIVPTYAIDYPVATTRSAIDTLEPWRRGGICEIGAHLHPWVNPPHDEDVSAHHSFASNLAPGLMCEKLTALRDAITANFGVPPLVYKAGRYGIGPETPAILNALGFIADTSVVPHLNSVDKGGPDFRALPDQPFMTTSGIAELPLSVHFAGRLARFGRGLYPVASRFERLRVPGVFSRLGLLERLRLSPEGHGIADMKRQTQAALSAGNRYFMLTYHSSSLMPGGTPYARSRAERDALVVTLTKYIEFFHQYAGMGDGHSEPVGRDDARGKVALTVKPSSLPSVSCDPGKPPRGKALVMGDDTRGFLATVRSLGRQGIEVHAAPFDFRAPALTSRYVAAIHDVPPWMGDGRAWIDAMQSLLAAEKFDLVIPCDERNLLPLHKNRAIFDGLARLAIPNARGIDVLFDKHETRLLAAVVGVPVAKGRLARADDRPDAVLAELGSPVVIKPRRSYTMDGLAKRGRVHVTADTQLIARLLAEAEPDSLILESCFEGPGLGLSILAHEGRLLQAFEHRRVHERSGSSFYRVSAAPTPDLVEACAAVTAGIGYTGVAMFEFKRNARGDWIMLEVNARPWGSLPLPVALGVDFPYRWYRLLVDAAETPPVPYRVGVFGRNLVPDLMSALVEAEAHDNRVRRAGSLARRLAGTRRLWVNAEKQDVLVSDDPAPFRAELTAILRGGASRLRRLAPGKHRLDAARARAVVTAVATQPGRPHILFACQGNICRSPYAEAVMHAIAGGSATVSSAGMMPRPGRPMPDLFQARARLEGLELADHRSIWLDRATARSASLIVLFDRVNQTSFADRYPDLAVPTLLLGDLIGVGEIADPIDGDAEIVAASYLQIRRGVECLAGLLTEKAKQPA